MNSQLTLSEIRPTWYIVFFFFISGDRSSQPARKPLAWVPQSTILHTEGEPYDVPLSYYENYFYCTVYRDIILRLSLRLTRGSNPRSPNNPRPTSTVPFLRDC